MNWVKFWLVVEMMWMLICIGLLVLIGRILCVLIVCSNLVCNINGILFILLRNSVFVFVVWINFVLLLVEVLVNVFLI